MSAIGFPSNSAYGIYEGKLPYCQYIIIHLKLPIDSLRKGVGLKPPDLIGCGGGPYKSFRFAHGVSLSRGWLKTTDL